MIIETLPMEVDPHRRSIFSVDRDRKNFGHPCTVRYQLHATRVRFVIRPRTRGLRQYGIVVPAFPTRAAPNSRAFSVLRGFEISAKSSTMREFPGRRADPKCSRTSIGERRWRLFGREPFFFFFRSSDSDKYCQGRN